MTAPQPKGIAVQVVGLSVQGETTDNMDLKLKPLYDPNAVLNVWPNIITGLESILEHAEADTSSERIINEILSKQLLLWIAFLDGRYCGFFTTKIEQAAPMTARYLTVMHLYAKPGSPPETINEGLAQLEIIAKREFGCNHIRFWSTRKGWEKKLKNWKQGYIEFYKPLKEDNEDL